MYLEIDEKHWKKIIKQTKKVFISSIEYWVNKNDEVEIIIVEVINKNKKYVAISPIRITRVPRLQPQVSHLMRQVDPDRWFLEEFDQFLTALWGENIPFMVKVRRFDNEIYLVIGAIGEDKNYDDVKRKALENREKLIAVLKSRFPQVEYEKLKLDKARELFPENYDENIGIILGIPSRPARVQEELKEESAKYHLETIWRGLLESNAEITVLAKPMSRNEIINRIIRIRKLLSDLESRMQGTDAWTFYVSLPAVFAETRISTAQLGKTTYHSIGSSVGHNVMESRSISIEKIKTHVYQKHSIHQKSRTIILQAHHSKSFQVSKGFSFQEITSETIMKSKTFSILRHYSESVGRGITATITSSFGKSVGETVSRGESIGITHGEIKQYGITQQVSEGLTRGFSYQQGFSQGIQYNWSNSRIMSKTMRFNEIYGETLMAGIQTGKTITRGSSYSHVLTHGRIQTYGVSRAWSYGKTATMIRGVNLLREYGWSTLRGITREMTRGLEVSRGETVGGSQGIALSKSLTESGTFTETHGKETGWNAGGGVSFIAHAEGGYHESSYDSFSRSHSLSKSFGMTESQRWMWSRSFSRSEYLSKSISSMHQWGFSRRFGFAHQYQQGIGIQSQYQRGVFQSKALTFSEEVGRTYSNSISASFMRTQQYGKSYQFGIGRDITEGMEVSQGRAINYQQSSMIGKIEQEQIIRSRGITNVFGISTQVSKSRFSSYAISKMQSWTLSRSRGWEMRVIKTVGETKGISESYALSETKGFARGRIETRTSGETIGTTKGTSETTGVSSGITKGETLGETHGISKTIGESHSKARTVSDAMGVVEGFVVGATQMISGGIVPGLTLSHSRQWKNVLIEGLARWIRRHELRYDLGKNTGMWNVCIIVSGEDANRIGTVLSGALRGPLSDPETIRYYILTTDEAKKLINYVRLGVFPEIKASRHPLNKYFFATELTTEELTAVSHFPRVEVKGIKLAEDIPMIFLQTPPEYNEQPRIKIGRIVDIHLAKPSESVVEYPVRKMKHILIAGTTRSGKTNAAMWLIIQLLKHNFDVIILDWKNTWRQLIYHINDDINAKIFTLAKPEVSPLIANPLRPPVINDHIVVSPLMWADIVSEIFAYAYAPFPRSRSIVREELEKLYIEKGVLENHGREFENYPLMSELVERILRRIEETDISKAGRGEIESLNAIRARLWEYASEVNILHKQFSTQRVGKKIEDLIKEEEKGKVTIIEAAGLWGQHKAFILSWIATSIYAYQTTLARPRRKPLVVVIEEAQHLIPPQTILNQVHIYESIWETMFRELGEYNVWLIAITQMPSKLPPSILGNTPMKIVLNLATSDEQGRGDIDLVMENIGLDPRWDHRHVKRFITRLPTGWAIVKLGYWEKQYDAWPYLIAFPKVISDNYPTDDEIKRIMGIKNE